MTKACSICSAALIRRSDEHLKNFEKRRTCGSRDCVYGVRRLNNKQRLPTDNERWWEPLTTLPESLYFTSMTLPPEDPSRLTRPSLHQAKGGSLIADFLTQPEAGITV